MTLSVGTSASQGQSGNSQQVTGFTTAASSHALILVAIFGGSGGTTAINYSVSDSAGLTWTNQISPNSTVQEFDLFYAFAPTGVSSDTITVTNSGGVSSSWGFLVLEIDGAATSSVFDPTTAGFSNAISPAPSCSTSNANDMILVFGEDPAGGTTTVSYTNSYATAVSTTAWSNVCAFAGIGYLVVSSAGTQTTTLTFGNPITGDFAFIIGVKAASGATNINLSDTASGTDTLILQADIPVTDTETGTDILNTNITSLLNETGSGNEIFSSLSVLFILNGTGNSSDTISIQNTIPALDLAGGNDILNTNISMTLNELGNGSDNFSSLDVLFTLFDNGSSTELLSIIIGNVITLLDSGSGTDILNLNINTALGEPSGGTDIFSSLLVSFPLNENASGTDSISITVANLVALFDTAIGTDTIQFSISFLLAETALGYETMSFIINNILSESATGLDVLSNVLINSLLIESGSGIESFTISNIFGINENSSGQDLFTPEVLFTLTDSALGNDIIKTFKPYLVQTLPPVFAFLPLINANAHLPSVISEQINVKLFFII